jgi:hypothetical protein
MACCLANRDETRMQCGVHLLVQGTELLAAGFPCIDVSRAGLRKGLEGQVGPIELGPVVSWQTCTCLHWCIC